MYLQDSLARRSSRESKNMPIKVRYFSFNAVLNTFLQNFLLMNKYQIAVYFFLFLPLGAKKGFYVFLANFAIYIIL